MGKLEQVAERDAWTCWLCEGAVDPAARPGSPVAPSLDHVLPRAHGGGHDLTNIRLAHRRCNSRRGSRLPELEWPERFALQHAAPLWPVLQRARRRVGSWETVGVALDDRRAQAAGRWVCARAELLLGGGWEARTRPLPGGLATLDVRAA